ncbi:hypothetical protein AB1Y20_011544 [Prymnesium parvum]|uniref:Carboxypeptidase n=1 Tax=Prymnesium parvum TaxID=97485 RepID=A0AB34IJQ5_PRYPA
MRPSLLLLASASARLLPPDASLPPLPERTTLPCASPTRRAPVHFPPSFTRGFSPPIDFPMESGYINVTSSDYLFYWYVGATPSAPPDAPLLVWSNGGPGCSAMEGATTEGGPLWLFDAKLSRATAALSRNPYAWNAQAHLLFVDQPRYVGFSTGRGPRVATSAAAAADMLRFLLGWRAAFPEHAHRRLLLASESYGGHYVPAWAAAILDHNARHAPRLPLAALLIGNGLIDGGVQQGSFAAFARAQRLIPPHAAPPTDGAARRLVEQSLGYTPNLYDYRLRDVSCCGCTSYNYSAWARWFTRPEVKAALHVCGAAGDAAFGGCAAGCVDMGGFDLFDNYSYSAALSAALRAGVDVTLYYGKQDTACNYVGGRRVAEEALQWGGARAFRSAAEQPLLVGGARVGESRRATAGGATLSFVAVDGAGHMVPMDQGAAASLALQTLISPRPAATPAPPAKAAAPLAKASEI